VTQDHPDWSRHKITKHICSQWGWYTHSDQPETFAARRMIDKLEQRGLLDPPPIRVSFRRKPRRPFPAGFAVPDLKLIDQPLAKLTPLSLETPTQNSYEQYCVGYYLRRHHYLGFNRTVGENIKYLVRDRSGQGLACLLFGSVVWKTAPRDAFIGWDKETRKANINFLTNNTRFSFYPSTRPLSRQPYPWRHHASHPAGLNQQIRRSTWWRLLWNAISSTVSATKLPTRPDLGSRQIQQDQKATDLH
jgi:hypothetical protein